MNLPEGQLLRRRVLTDIGTVLTTALDRKLTGYARLEPQETLLLDNDGVGVLTFERGVPAAAYHTGTDATGPDAITEIGGREPYRLELYELDAGVIEQIREETSLRVPPAMPATQLSGDSDLVERTREHAPAEWLEDEQPTDNRLAAAEEFLDDSDRIERIRERARTEAESRADKWNLPTESDRQT